MIKTLTGALPTIEKQIDALVLKCSGFSESASIDSTDVSAGIVYRVDPSEFLRYLQNNYGVSVGSNSGITRSINGNLQGGAGSGSSLDLLLTNIFSPVWQKSFGSPFSSDPYF
jgi:hypothetical protein